MNINKRRSIHSGRLERWLGAENIESLANNMRHGGGPNQRWHGGPINLRDVPGSVWITADGDFVGDFERGFFDSAYDSFERFAKRLWRESGRNPEPAFGAGFTSISDALGRASAGYSQSQAVAKIGNTGVTASGSTLWGVGPSPAAGAPGSAAPGGRACDRTTVGAIAFNNPASGTLHLTGADMSANTINNSLLLYDRLFDVAKTMNSTATESVTGVPTRYQSSTVTAMDYAGGNFLVIGVEGVLAATAHNWTVCQYRNQAGTDAQTLPSVTGISGAILGRFDMPLSSWFCPLASGDTGVMDLAQMQCSALVATGAINFVIGHPIGIMTFPVVNQTLPFDWLTNRNQAPRIFDNACLSFMELAKPSTPATTYTGVLYATNAAP